MEVKIKVIKVGNSKAVRIPKIICDSLDLQVNDDLILDVNDNEITLKIKEATRK